MQIQLIKFRNNNIIKQGTLLLVAKLETSNINKYPADVLKKTYNSLVEASRKMAEYFF